MNPTKFTRKAILKKRRKLRSYEARLVDKKVKYCKKCKRSWELVQAHGNDRRKSTQYYLDYVTFGKEKIICRECKQE